MNKLPLGCDYQGRHPEAAHAATDVGTDNGQPDGSGIVWGVISGLVAWFAVAMCAVIVLSVQ